MYALLIQIKIMQVQKKKVDILQRSKTILLVGRQKKARVDQQRNHDVVENLFLYIHFVSSHQLNLEVNR